MMATELSRLRIGMGTFIAIEAVADTREICDLGVSDAFRAVAQVERLMHPTRGGSDLAAMRDWPLDVPLSVHAWTWATLALCKRLNDMSHGNFDPCLPESHGRLPELELRPPYSDVLTSLAQRGSRRVRLRAAYELDEVLLRPPPISV